MDPTTTSQQLSPLELGAAAVLIIWVLKTSYDFAINILNITKTTPKEIRKQAEQDDGNGIPKGFTARDRSMLNTASIQIEKIHKELAVTRGLEAALLELAKSNERQLKILDEITELNRVIIKVLTKLSEKEE